MIKLSIVQTAKHAVVLIETLVNCSENHVHLDMMKFHINSKEIPPSGATPEIDIINGHVILGIHVYIYGKYFDSDRVHGKLNVWEVCAVLP